MVTVTSTFTTEQKNAVLKRDELLMNAMITKELQPIRVDTIQHAQIVRLIRNEVKSFMTSDHKHITAEEQYSWWDLSRVLYLYENLLGVYIGFGYIREINGKKWGTLAVLPEFQNEGYGTDIYKHLLDVAGELWLEIYSDNTPSLIAALKNGFVVQSANEITVTLKGNKR
jgi:GNAT superfamily N-acetyltransferase